MASGIDPPRNWAFASVGGLGATVCAWTFCPSCRQMPGGSGETLRAWVAACFISSRTSLKRLGRGTFGAKRPACPLLPIGTCSKTPTFTTSSVITDAKLLHELYDVEADWKLLIGNRF